MKKKKINKIKLFSDFSFFTSNSIFIFFSFLVFSVLTFNQNVYSAYNGEIQIAIPAPSPVEAGNQIQFQIIAVNTGDKIWINGNYKINIEIFDDKNTYITHTKDFIADKDILTSQKGLYFINYNIPDNFSGTYFFRVKINTFDGIEILKSENYELKVIPKSLPKIEESQEFENNEKEIPKLFSGNLIVSEKSNFSDFQKNFLGNISLNLFSRLSKQKFFLNSYTNHSTAKPVDFYNFLIDFDTDKFAISLGDIMPSLSHMSLSDSGVRGLFFKNKNERLKTSIIVAEKPESRFVFGGSLSTMIKDGFELFLSAAETGDTKSSVIPSKKIPVKNDVVSVGVKSRYQFYLFDAEFTKSFYWPDINTSSNYLEDIGLWTNAGVIFPDFDVNLEYQKTNPNFYSLGNPTITKDRNIYKGLANIRIYKNNNLRINYEISEDNPTKSTATINSKQQIYGSDISLNFGKLPVIDINYSKNENTSSDVLLIKNETDVVSINISKYYNIFGYNISGQLSKFNDLTGVSKKIDSNSFGVNLNFGSGKVFLTNIGSSYSESGKSKVISGSLTNNIRIGKDFVILLSGYYISRDDSEYNIKDNTFRGNFECNYNVNQNTILVIGTGVENVINNISENIRFQVNF